MRYADVCVGTPWTLSVSALKPGRGSSPARLSPVASLRKCQSSLTAQGTRRF